MGIPTTLDVSAGTLRLIYYFFRNSHEQSLGGNGHILVWLCLLDVFLRSILTDVFIDIKGLQLIVYFHNVARN